MLAIFRLSLKQRTNQQFHHLKKDQIQYCITHKITQINRKNSCIMCKLDDSKQKQHKLYAAIFMQKQQYYSTNTSTTHSKDRCCLIHENFACALNIEKLIFYLLFRILCDTFLSFYYTPKT